MRGSRTLVFCVAAVTAAGLFLEAAAETASNGMLQVRMGGSAAGGSTASVPKGGASSRSNVAREAVAAALATLEAGGLTLAGPGHYLLRVDDETRIYEVMGGAAVDVCVTLNNLSTNPVHLSVAGAGSLEIDGGETRAPCFAAPLAIVVECREGASCEGVWRVDRR